MVVWNVHISVLWNVLSLFVYFNCQPVPPSIHPSLHLVDFILLEIFCFCFLLYAACIAHACDRCVIRVPTNAWRPTASTLCPTNATIEKALELCRNYDQNKVQKHQPQRICWLQHWWQFQTQNFSRYSARLHGWLKERKKMDNSDLWPFQVNRLPL